MSVTRLENDLENDSVNTVRRTNAWTADDDQLLGDLVLSTIRNGDTQLNAFKATADQLGRTSAACGFRWNGMLRHHYKAEIEAAQREKRLRWAPRNTDQPETVDSSSAMKEAIHFLKTVDQKYQHLRSQKESLMLECDRLREKLKDLEKLMNAERPATSVSSEQVQQDVKRLAEITIRARKL